MIADLSYIILDKKNKENEITLEYLLHFLDWLYTHNLDVNKLNMARIIFWLDVFEREIATDFSI